MHIWFVYLLCEFIQLILNQSNLQIAGHLLQQLYSVALQLVQQVVG